MGEVGNRQGASSKWLDGEFGHVGLWHIAAQSQCGGMSAPGGSGNASLRSDFAF
jgi:hypothetical protein